MEEQRFWSRGDTGMTELLGVTAKDNKFETIE